MSLQPAAEPELAAAARPRWRLLDHGDRTAAENMAVDEAVLAACSRGQAPPTLRFYGWNPPAVTLGYFQAPETDLDLAACRALGIDWVRRITGGRAVLHDGELTYSLCAQEQWLPGSVEAAHRQIAKALALGLAQLGLEPRLGAKDAGAGGSSAACFDAPARTELTVDGRKLVGSAQTRRHGALMQHGSIPIQLHAEKLAAAVGIEAESRRAFCRMLEARATALDRVTEPLPGMNELRAAFTQGFAQAFGVGLRRGQLTPEERQHAARLTPRYREEAWTWARKGR